MCFERSFAIRAQDVDRLDDGLVDILDELFDGFREGRTFRGREGPLIVWKCCYALNPFSLLEFTRLELALLPLLFMTSVKYL